MTPGRGVVRLLLVLTAGSLGLSISLLLVRALDSRRPLRLDQLGESERHQLVEEELTRAGTVYSAADFDPRLGYTLERAAEITAWGQSFRTNELGFRAGPVAKAPGSFRVVFVGDSWTFGLGESFEDSFPGQFEQLARDLVNQRQVEAWPLALPGYNALNEAAALEAIGPLLEPDAVVWCPTNNDVSSSMAADPRGFLRRRDESDGDAFGDGMYREFTLRFVDSYRYLARWRRAAAEYGRADRRLRARGVPLALLFTARWQERWAAAIVSEAGLRGAWAVAPREWGKQRNKFNHGTPECYREYARLAYRLIAATAAGWPQLEPKDVLGPGGTEIRYGASDVPGIGVSKWAEPWAARRSPVEFVPDPVAARDEGDRCFGTMDCSSGRVGRHAAILLYRAQVGKRLRIALRRIDTAPPGFYPISVRLAIPRPNGGTAVAVEIPSTGPSEVSASLELPRDLEPGAAFELEVSAEAAVLDPLTRMLQSIQIVHVRPED